VNLVAFEVAEDPAPFLETTTSYSPRLPPGNIAVI
jgi:hypothetical protein